MESNDSPEIPDRGETSDIPGLPSGVVCGVILQVKVLLQVYAHFVVLDLAIINSKSAYLV